MADIKRGGPGLVESIRQHVLTPLSEAQRLVQREHDEVEVERQAFQRFKERVADLDPSSPQSTVPVSTIATGNSDAQPQERLRRAYRQTVMNVPHFDDVYGESLDANLSAEFSPEVIVGMQHDGPPFTDMYKIRLVSAVNEAISQRETFCNMLENEQRSIATCHEELTDIIDHLDGPQIPTWYSAKFEGRLSELAQARQETLQTRSRSGHIDGHDLCAYLYREPEWTHPILTAVARLRGTVDYRS